MSFEGQVLCQRIEIGPVWPFAIIGKPRVAPAAATPEAAFRNLRRSAATPLSTTLTLRDFDLRIMFPPSDLKGAAPDVRDGDGHKVPLRPSRSSLKLAAICEALYRALSVRRQVALQ